MYFSGSTCLKPESALYECIENMNIQSYACTLHCFPQLISVQLLCILYRGIPSFPDDNHVKVGSEQTGLTALDISMLYCCIFQLWREKLSSFKLKHAAIIFELLI